MIMKFYYQNIELEVPEGVYYPREDSMLMAGVIEKADLKGKRCLDMGCGSGFLAILMAKKGAAVTAADVNATAVEAARKNASRNNAGVDFVCSDLFSGIKGKFDLAVFNPPYLPVDDEYADESFSGGETGRDAIERFLEEARAFMSEKGQILLLVSSLTGEKEVTDAARRCGFREGILAREKLDWEEIIAVRLE